MYAYLHNAKYLRNAYMLAYIMLAYIYNVQIHCSLTSAGQKLNASVWVVVGFLVAVAVVSLVIGIIRFIFRFRRYIK